MAELAILVSSLSAFGGALLYKGSAFISFKYGEKLKRKYEKTKLANELSNSIQNLKFIDFQNCNYKIKVYDNNYNKEQYVKMKKKYRYTDEETNDEMKFLKRFDISYTRFDSYKPYLQQMIKEEVERSLSRDNYSFNIQRSKSNYRLEDIDNFSDLIKEDLNTKKIEDKIEEI